MVGYVKLRFTIYFQNVEDAHSKFLKHGRSHVKSVALIWWILILNFFKWHSQTNFLCFYKHHPLDLGCVNLFFYELFLVAFFVVRLDR
jgi:hypothetical protein